MTWKQGVWDGGCVEGQEAEGPRSGRTGELWGGVGDSTIGRSGLARKNTPRERSEERKGLFSFLMDGI